MGRLFIVHTKRASLKMPFFLQVLFQFLEIRKEVAYGVREAFAGREDLEYGAHGLAELRIILHESEDGARVDCIGERRVLTALEPASHRAECMLQCEAVVEAEAVVEFLLQIDPPRIEPVYIKVRELQPALFSQLLNVGHTPGVYLRLRRADPRDKRMETVRERRMSLDLLLCDARELGNMFLYHPVFGTDIALEFVFLLIILIQTHGADLNDLPVQLSSYLSVFLRDGVHLQIYDDVFHEQTLLSKKSAVSDARQTVLRCFVALPYRRAFSNIEFFRVFAIITQRALKINV